MSNFISSSLNSGVSSLLNRHTRTPRSAAPAPATPAIPPRNGDIVTIGSQPTTAKPIDGTARVDLPTYVGHQRTPAEKQAVTAIEQMQQQVNAALQRDDLSADAKQELWTLKRWFERSARDAAVQTDSGNTESMQTFTDRLADLQRGFSDRFREITTKSGTSPASSTGPRI